MRIFTLEELSPGRWRVSNAIAPLTWVTYGTREEVEAYLEEHEAAWAARLRGEIVKGKRGDAMRVTHSHHVNIMAAKKRATALRRAS